MAKSTKTLTLSNDKEIRIIIIRRMDLLIHCYNREDVFKAIGLKNSSLTLAAMHTSEHDYYPTKDDPMAYLTDTALLLLPERSPGSFEQRKLIIELLRMNFIDKGL